MSQKLILTLSNCFLHSSAHTSTSHLCQLVLKPFVFTQSSLARKFTSPGTIRNYLHRAKVLHTINCVDSVQFDHPCVALILKGISCGKQHMPHQALPFTTDMLRKSRRLLDLSHSQDATIWTLLLFSYFLMLRKSNAVPDAIQKFDKTKQLIHQDVTMGSKALLVSLKLSKTLQFGGRRHMVPLLSNPGSQLCPVKAYQAMCRVVPSRSQDLLFQNWSNKGWVPLTYAQYQRQLKNIVTAIGSECTTYSTHSLHRGGTTYIPEIGVSREIIMLVGDWKSDAVDQYLHIDLPLKVQQQVKLNSKSYKLNLLTDLRLFSVLGQLLSIYLTIID